MSLATVFLLISSSNLLTHMLAWLLGVVIVLSLFLLNRHRIKSQEQDAMG